MTTSYLLLLSGAVAALSPAAKRRAGGEAQKSAAVAKAAPAGAHAAPSAGAQKLLDRVRRTYVKRAYAAAFSQTYVDEVTGPRATETGRLEVTGDGKVRFAYDGELAKLFVFDGHDAWFAEPDAAQVTRFTSFAEGPAGEALAFLWGGGADLRNFAAALCDADCPELAADEDAVTFRPRRPMAAVTRVDLSVQRTSGEITAVRVRDTLGNETRYTLSARRFDVALAPAAFSYVPPKDFNVVQALAQ